MLAEAGTTTLLADGGIAVEPGAEPYTIDDSPTAELEIGPARLLNGGPNEELKLKCLLELDGHEYPVPVPQ